MQPNHVEGSHLKYLHGLLWPQAVTRIYLQQNLKPQCCYAFACSAAAKCHQSSVFDVQASSTACQESQQRSPSTSIHGCRSCRRSALLSLALSNLSCLKSQSAYGQCEGTGNQNGLHRFLSGSRTGSLVSLWVQNLLSAEKRCTPLCRYGDMGASSSAPSQGASLGSSMVQLRVTCLQDTEQPAILTKRFPSASRPTQLWPWYWCRSGPGL